MGISQDWRFEKKCLIPFTRRKEVENFLKTNMYFFKESYPSRQVNSLYFEHPDLITCMENIEGISERAKYRVRWYGNVFDEVKDGLFEYKIKKNQTNSKNSVRLEPFHFNQYDETSSLIKKIQFSEVSPIDRKRINSLKPIVFTNYNRAYLESICGSIRATIDNKIVFRKASKPLLKYTVREYNILEFKYSKKNEDKFLRLRNKLPFKFSAISKYLSALKALSII